MTERTLETTTVIVGDSGENLQMAFGTERELFVARGLPKKGWRVDK